MGRIGLVSSSRDIFNQWLDIIPMIIVSLSRQKVAQTTIYIPLVVKNPSALPNSYNIVPFPLLDRGSTGGVFGW